jgi:hypothetical protein
MDFLGFVDWRAVNRRFCVVMWLVAVVLALVLLAHTGSPSAAVHHIYASPRR